MALKIPPPPQFTGVQWQTFNRWLVELTSILAAGGGIDPNTIDGFAALQNQVDTNTTDITALQGTTGGQAVSIAVLQSQITTLTNGLALANASITTLSARAQVFSAALGGGVPNNAIGVDGDWFLNTTGAAGAKMYTKAAGAWGLVPNL